MIDMIDLHPQEPSTSDDPMVPHWMLHSSLLGSQRTRFMSHHSAESLTLVSTHYLVELHRNVDCCSIPRPPGPFGFVVSISQRGKASRSSASTLPRQTLQIEMSWGLSLL